MLQQPGLTRSNSETLQKATMTLSGRAKVKASVCKAKAKVLGLNAKTKWFIVFIEF